MSNISKVFISTYVVDYTLKLTKMENYVSNIRIMHNSNKIKSFRNVMPNMIMRKIADLIIVQQMFIDKTHKEGKP